MDATSTDYIAIPAPTRFKGGRPASDYRAARRNAAKANRQLSEWRKVVAVAANVRAKLYERSQLANGAREAAAAAIAAHAAGQMKGEPVHAVVRRAMLGFYRTAPAEFGKVATGRAVSRIMRELAA